MSDDLYFGVPPAPASTETLSQVGAWRVLRLLGSGATADVFLVEHSATRVRAALKRLRPGPGRLRFRNEVLALGGVDIDGVVRILDDGVHAGWPYVVQDFVEGTPFPGTPEPKTWKALAPRAESLLLGLYRLHHNGLFHLDVKPSNALVDATGKVTLVDLGLSQGPLLGDRPGGEELAAGTLAYAPPEQLAGSQVDASSDLFAVGRMLQELVHPNEAPDQVTATIERMCHVAPHERPGDALEVLCALGLDPLVKVQDMALEDQEDRVLRPLEDARRALQAACEHRPREDVLRSWLALGYLEPGPAGRLRPTRHGRIALVGPQVHWTASLSELAEYARATAGRGELAASAAAWRVVCARARWTRWDGQAADMDEEGSLLSWLDVAVRLEDPQEVERVGYAIARVPEASASLRQLRDAAVQVARGAREEARASLLPRMSSVEPQLWWRLRLQASARMPIDAQRMLLDEAEAWARATGDPDIESQVDGWRGLLLYQQARYSEAADQHERALEHITSAPRRISALLNASSCRMEAGEYDRAEALGKNGLALSTELRHAALALRAEWLLRSVAYRAGRTMKVDRSLVQAARDLGIAPWEGLILLNEAAVAWRAGSPDLEGLATLAMRALEEARMSRPAQLARALVVSTSGDSAAANRMLQELGDPEGDDLGWQVAGVLVHSGVLDAKGAAIARQRAALAGRPHDRRELLAPVEVLSGRASHGRP